LADQIGRLVDGRYAVEGVLGSGGMGVVLRARHKFTGAEVALKMLHEALHMDTALESRFLAEARASNQIGHPAIVQVLDAGRTPEGELYLVMELLVGQSLRDAMGQPPAEIRRIASGLLDALGAAHARGFVHRDLKPENVFLSGPERSVKLLDFGIAKGVKSATIGLPRTAAGVLLGTLAYMAPEQLRDASTVDPRADLWGMGVMIYEMISGHLPFQAYSIEELYMKLARHEPDSIQRWVPTIAPEVEQFFARALARDPNARFATAAEMSAAVMQLPLGAHLVVTPQPRGGDSGTMATGLGSAPTYAASMPTPPPAPYPTPYPPTAFPTPYPPAPPAYSTPYPPQGVITPHTPYPPQAVITPYPALPIVPRTPQELQTGPQPLVPRSYDPPTGPYPLVTPSASGVAHAPPRGSRAIALVLVTLAAAAVIVAIVVATHNSTPPAKVATAAPIDAATPDAALAVAPVVPVVVDAKLATVTPRVRDAGVDASHRDAAVVVDALHRDAAAADAPHADAGVKPMTGSATPLDPYAPAAPHLDCVAACGFLDRCGMKSAKCIQECATTNGYNGCLTAVNTDCDKFAACFLGHSCGAVGRGTASCKDTLQCQLHCKAGDRACACGCVASSATSNLSELLSYNICTQACGTDKDCVARTCTAAYNRCKAQ
jgi:serine/threonine-protein kinase